MWALKIILLLLPAIAYCRISIRISPGMTEADTTVAFSGSDTAIISDKERKTFKLDETNVNKAVKAWKGNTCTSSFVKPPTPYGDVWEAHGWDVVMRTLRPVGYKILGINPKPDAVVTAEYENSHDTVTATYSTTVEKSVSEEVSHGWSKSGELSIGQEISYSISVGAASVGGSTSLSYTSGWGEEKSETKTVTLGTTSTIETPVPPGEKVVATLTAESATLEVEVYYEATLNNGDVFCNYEGKYNGHHFWAWPLRILQSEGNLPKTIKSTERISVGFYSNAKLKISNGKEVPAGIKT